MESTPEDFVVEEITTEGRTLKRDQPFLCDDEELRKPNYFFSRFVLQKRLWNTGSALNEVARRLHVKESRLNSAGNKDRNAVTVQLCSAFAVRPEQLMELRIRDIKILGAWLSNEKVRMGELLGNHFEIRLREAAQTIDGSKLKTENPQLNAGSSQLKTETSILGTESPKLATQNSHLKTENSRLVTLMPNFFGGQRFGSVRKNTAEVGRLLLQGKFEEAVMHYLCSTEGETDAEAIEARKRLLETRDFKEALNAFPKHLTFERRIIAHLAGEPTNFIGAFRKLQRGTQLLFIHAFQSKMFNEMVEMRAAAGKLAKPEAGDRYCHADSYGFPDDKRVQVIETGEQLLEAEKLIEEERAFIVGNLVGHETQASRLEKESLEREGVKQEDFKLKSLPELSSKGTVRPVFVFIRNLEFDGGAVKFDLPSGSYATIALKHLAGEKRQN